MVKRLAVVVLRATVARERHLRGGANDGHRRSQFMRRVGHELPLRVQRGRQTIEQLVERGRKPSELVVAVRRAADGRRIALRDRRGLLAMSVSGLSVWRPTTHPPPAATTSATGRRPPSAVSSSACSASSPAKRRDHRRDITVVAVHHWVG